MTRQEIKTKIEELERVIANHNTAINQAESKLEDLQDTYDNMKDFQEAL